MSLKGYRDVPYPLGTPEWESFKRFAVTYYKEAFQIASTVSEELTEKEIRHRLDDFGKGVVFASVAKVTLSPLVFLWEKWQLMSLDDKLKYATPEYKAELERIKAESQQAKDKVKDEKWVKT